MRPRIAYSRVLSILWTPLATANQIRVSAGSSVAMPTLYCVQSSTKAKNSSSSAIRGESLSGRGRGLMDLQSGKGNGLKRWASWATFSETMVSSLWSVRLVSSIPLRTYVGDADRIIDKDFLGSFDDLESTRIFGPQWTMSSHWVEDPVRPLPCSWSYGVVSW